MSEADRPTTPFGRRFADVAGNERVGPYHLVSVYDSDGPHDPRPGQFYMLAAERGWDGGRPYLFRALSFCRADGAGTLEFLIDAIGPGTIRLSDLHAGERVHLLGPLGNGFGLQHEEPSLLVGGGIGVAPLVALQEKLGRRAEVFLGFRSEVHAAARSLFSHSLSVVTDDGSIGRQALVTELLGERLGRDSGATVYACGPPAMLEAVRAQCASTGTRVLLAMEAGMACGYGACFGCVHPTKAGYVRLCIDGPVLEGSQLETALGAGVAVH